MQPYGTDRVRVAGTKVILHAAVAKGWNGRGTRAPGTAVLWDEQWFEVLQVDASASGATYVLVPWPEAEAIRLSSRYDEESEAERAKIRAAEKRREKQAAATTFLGIVVGHAPAAIQTHIGNELGIAPSRMTLLSTIPGFLLAGIWIYLAVASRIDQEPMPGTLGLLAFVLYLLVDSGVRAQIAITQDRPVGSALGFLLYSLLFAIAPKTWSLLSPLTAEKGTGTMTLPPDEEVALRDAVAVRAPLLSLLSPAEQLRLADRFGFDWRRNGQLTAWIILIGATMGVVSSGTSIAYDGARMTAILSVCLATLLAVEQVIRLRALQRGPAGSILAAVVRPLVRSVVERA